MCARARTYTQAQVQKVLRMHARIPNILWERGGRREGAREGRERGRGGRDGVMEEGRKGGSEGKREPQGGKGTRKVCR
jgi:hypothetical protein